MEQYYNSVSDSYKKADRSTNRTPAMLNVLKPRIPSTILDVGCGVGSQVRVLTSLGCDVTGVDVSEGMLSLAKERCNGGDVNLIHGDILETSFDKKFDYVIFCDSFEHFNNPVDVLAHVRKFLKKDGLLYFSVPNGTGWMRRMHTFIRTCLGSSIAPTDEVYSDEQVTRIVTSVFPEFGLLERFEFGEFFDITGNMQSVTWEPVKVDNGCHGLYLALLYGKEGTK